MFYLKKYDSVEELKSDFKEYINYYNNDWIFWTMLTLVILKI